MTVNSIKCLIQDCPSVYKTEDPVKPGARFVCKGVSEDGYKIPGHTRKAVVEALGRRYNPVKDNADADVHFQDYQFDSELGPGKKVLIISKHVDDDPETPVAKAAQLWLGRNIGKTGPLKDTDETT